MGKIFKGALVCVLGFFPALAVQGEPRTHDNESHYSDVSERAKSTDIKGVIPQNPQKFKSCI